jgi:hypothetical protein
LRSSATSTILQQQERSITGSAITTPTNIFRRSEKITCYEPRTEKYR